MKFSTKSLIVSALLVAAFSAGMATGWSETISADDGHDHGQASQNDAQSAEEQSSESYEYTAQPGDTFTKMARKAIQTYGINNSINLSGAEIIYAETNLAKEAGSPVLNVGQKVNIEHSVVKKWIENAQKLDDATEAKWNKYVSNVDFNTDKVGEARE